MDIKCLIMDGDLDLCGVFLQKSKILQGKLATLTLGQNKALYFKTIKLLSLL